jgi:asparagine synthase (glutamine-hydrolysing)
MCGIYGFVGEGANSIERQGQVSAMGNLLVHRGPDGVGLLTNKNYTFGHRRLSIIDLDHGMQPMESDDGAIVLVFNGEIYNYLELRQDLVRDGVHFKTHSDTEVLLRCYEKYGENLLQRLNGMFSFGIFDSRKNIFFAARDHFGIKPLYYVILENGPIVFASEIKALFCVPEIKKILNISAFHEYLNFQFCLGDKTLFKGISKLLPAHSLIFKVAEKRVDIKKWWSLDYSAENEHSKDYIKSKLNYLIQDSVKGQMRSDVPIGAYLSGGLDSSIIVASAATHYGPGFKCFTGKFTEGAEFDESQYARSLSDAYNCDYHEVIPTPQDFILNIGDLIYHMDEPAAGPGLFPQFMVSKYAKNHVSVILGGQGGDELFGGYARYLIAYLEQCIKGAIFETQEEAEHIVTLDSIIPNLPALKNYVPMLSNFWKSGLFDPMEERYFKLLDRGQKTRSMINPDFAVEFDEERMLEEFSLVFNSSGSKSYLNKMTNFDLNTSLPALLQVEDRVSMAVSLESRVPLLDYRIAELTACISPSLKYAGGNSKSILKDSMLSLLPKKIIERRDKMGFPVPLDQWLEGPLKEFVFDTLLSNESIGRGVFNINKLKNLTRNEDRYGREIWGALCLELWFQNCMS